MSNEQTPGIEELMAMLKKQTEGESSNWSQKKPPVSADIQAVSIPISIQMDSGKIRVYLHFNGEVASSPESLMNLIGSLEQKGFPLDFWKSKNDWNQKKKGW